MGFTKGNNVAIKVSHGKYVYLLGIRILKVHEGCIDSLADYLDQKIRMSALSGTQGAEPGFDVAVFLPERSDALEQFLFCHRTRWILSEFQVLQRRADVLFQGRSDCGHGYCCRMLFGHSPEGHG